MDLNLNGRAAAVAASSAGLGFSTALTLAQEGCRVAICARNEERLQDAAARIRSETNAEVIALVADMSDAEAPDAFVKAAADRFGGLDIAVANAGGPPSGEFVDKTDTEWAMTLQQNLMSTVRLFRSAVSFVTASDQGRLVAITSVSAKHPMENMVLSNSSRAGVHGVVKTLSIELATTGTTVNAVCPGVTKTDRLDELAQQAAEQKGITIEEAFAEREQTVPMGRLGTAAEFGAAVTFLCSKQAGFITGISLTADGGFMGSLP